ncbi:MAG: proline racemase family protein [Planctomycetota bacterium]
MSIVEAIDSHTEGEPTRVVLGYEDVAGATMTAKLETLRTQHDEVRRALVLEPRGHNAVVLAFLTAPATEGAHAGVVFANDAGYLGMCGHGAIGVATTLVYTGRAPADEPDTELRLDTPAGPVRARVRVRGGKPRAVAIANVASFVADRGIRVDVPGVGQVSVDVAYGGNWFGFVHVRDVGLPVQPDHIEPLMVAAKAIRATLAARGIQGCHPATGVSGPIDHIKIWVEDTDGAADGPAARALTLCPGSAYDRSPCGTGTSAKLALLADAGEIAVGQTFRSRSVLGTEFTARVLAETALAGGGAAVLPEIEGSAWVTGYPRFVLDPDDPLVHGFG